MKKRSEKFARYHDSFMGDTYDACERCGGKCEKYKISTLVPGEKEFMAERLNVSVTELEEKYLSEINTPFGNVDVLKMKDNCPFLDEEYRCTAIPAKPVLCDTYPVIFYISKGKVNFKIDQSDCPMVHWAEYSAAVKGFETNGIKALKAMKIPLSWWGKVALYDEYDFDYSRIEKDLGRTTEYATFNLELLLGYACNGYEVRARKTGIRLLNERCRQASAVIERNLAFNGPDQKKVVRDLSQSLRFSMNGHLREVRQILDYAKKNDGLISSEDGSEYRTMVTNVLKRIGKIEEETKRLRHRLLQMQKRKRVAVSKGVLKSIPLQTIDSKFYSLNFKRLDDFNLYQLVDERTKDFKEAYRILAQNFFTDEIDSPIVYEQSLKNGRSFINPNQKQSRIKNIWSRWIMVIIKDHRGKIAGVADGAVIFKFQASTFYASHIAVKPELRSLNLGTLLTAAIVQVAENELMKFAGTLPFEQRQEIASKGLMSEIGEIEFPEDTDIRSMTNRRLIFHGRLGRSVIWPVRYAQMDTDYHFKEFDPAKWNSVPMFSCFRAFNPEYNNTDMALKALDLLFDFFSSLSGSFVEWDREFLKTNLGKDGIIRLIPLPRNPADLPGFIELTGIRHVLLQKYFPDHLYTRSFL